MQATLLPWGTQGDSHPGLMPPCALTFQMLVGPAVCPRGQGPGAGGRQQRHVCVFKAHTFLSLNHLHVESKTEIQMNFSFTKQKQTHIHRKQPFGYQREEMRVRMNKLVIWD